MAQIRITKAYPPLVNGKPNAVQFMVGEVYEASIPLGGGNIKVKKVVANPNAKVESASLTWVDLPVGYFEILPEKNIDLNNLKTRLDFLDTIPLNPDNKEDLTKKKSKSTGYIVLGIFVVGAISLIIINRSKK
jgi:hypothetical protein